MRLSLVIDTVDDVIRACTRLTPGEAVAALALALGRAQPLAGLPDGLVRDLIGIGRGTHASMSLVLARLAACERRMN